MRFKFFLFCLFLFPTFIFAESHPLIYMICSPRSLSTVFLRMMNNRGDFEVYNEPSLPIYLINHADRVLRNMLPGHANSFEEYSTSLLEEIKSKPLFVKDTASTVYDFFKQENELAKNPNVRFVFLVRNPSASVISYYNKNVEHGIFENMKEHFSERLGLKKLYGLYEELVSKAYNTPYIIFSEELCERPEEEVLKFCKAVGIPFSQDHLSWKHIDDPALDDEISKWHDYKAREVSRVWHDDALKSSCFHSPRKYLTDGSGNPTFGEIANRKDRAIVKEAYEENKVYYEKFLELKSTL